MTSDVRVALAFGAASGLAVAALFPYLLVVTPKLRTPTRPLWLIVMTRAGNAALTMFVLAWIGLRLGAPLGLDAPLMRAWVDHGLTNPLAASVALAVAVGVGVGTLILALDRLLFLSVLRVVVAQGAPRVARWKGLLAAFYGAIVEEVLSRLFLMSVIAWTGVVTFHRPGARLFVAASLLSAIGFAAGHLPAAAQLAPLTRPVVARVMVLNTLAGFAFGILFWRYGVEHAMVAHFSTDLVLHVVVGSNPTVSSRRHRG